MVGVLESVRVSTIGVTSLQSRLMLDGLVAAALALMSIFMVRSIGRMQQRLERHNEELLALHSAGLDVDIELGATEEQIEGRQYLNQVGAPGRPTLRARRP